MPIACSGSLRRPVFCDVVGDVVRGRFLEEEEARVLATACDDDGGGDEAAAATCVLGPGEVLFATATAGADEVNDTGT